MKFFNKIRQNLLKENRLSRYLAYAFGEIVLVVLGILIALQINNWNEEKKRDARIQVMLDLTLGDLEVSIQELDDQVLYFDQQIARIALILKTLDKCDLDEEQLEEFERGLDFLYRLPDPNLELPNLKALSGSADFNFIHDQNIRARILDALYRSEEFDYILNHSRVLLDILNETVFESITYLPPDDYPSSRQLEIVYDLESLCGSTEFKYTVGNALKINTFGYNEAGKMKQELENLLLILK